MKIIVFLNENKFFSLAIQRIKYQVDGKHIFFSYQHKDLALLLHVCISTLTFNVNKFNFFTLF